MKILSHLETLKKSVSKTSNFLNNTIEFSREILKEDSFFYSKIEEAEEYLFLHYNLKNNSETVDFLKTPLDESGFSKNLMNLLCELDLLSSENKIVSFIGRNNFNLYKEYIKKTFFKQEAFQLATIDDKFSMEEVNFSLICDFIPSIELFIDDNQYILCNFPY